MFPRLSALHVFEVWPDSSSVDPLARSILRPISRVHVPQRLFRRSSTGAQVQARSRCCPDGIYAEKIWSSENHGMSSDLDAFGGLTSHSEPLEDDASE
jgi:hypothetical protein